jgi:hypothetical protein
VFNKGFALCTHLFHRLLQFPRALLDRGTHSAEVVKSRNRCQLFGYAIEASSNSVILVSERFRCPRHDDQQVSSIGRFSVVMARDSPPQPRRSSRTEASDAITESTVGVVPIDSNDALDSSREFRAQVGTGINSAFPHLNETVTIHSKKGPTEGVFTSLDRRRFDSLIEIALQRDHAVRTNRLVLKKTSSAANTSFNSPFAAFIA